MKKGILEIKVKNKWKQEINIIINTSKSWNFVS